MWEAISSLYFIVKVVVVAFGVIGGAFIGTVLAPLIGKRKTGMVVTIGCAILGGFIMWLAVNHLGGRGHGGEGEGAGNGSRSGPGAGTGSTRSSSREPMGRSLANLNIKMLGGTQGQDQRLYVIGDERPRNWDELLDAIAERQRHDPPLQEITIVILPHSVDTDNPAVTRLANWARKNHLTVTMSLPPEDMP